MPVDFLSPTEPFFPFWAIDFLTENMGLGRLGGGGVC